MFRSSLIAAGAVLLCSTAAAQQRLDPARLFPITGPVKDAGTVDVTTGKWTKPSHQTGTQKAGTIQTIYKNNCTWATQGYYAGFESCEWNFDEGRVPSTSSPSAPTGAVDNNVMQSFQFSYCTFVGTTAVPTGYDMEMAFYDKNGGNCAGFIPQQPPAVSTTANAYFDLSGLGLPGSAATGTQACWLVTIDVSNTGWVLPSDGEGTFDNDQVNDKFIWAQAQNSQTIPVAGGPNPDGFIISAEPATGGYGACSYTIPCGTDALFGNTCGTGLDTWDASWINVDGVAQGTPGVPLASCPNSVAQYGFGTNCYFFGGYPGNPFASYWLVLKARSTGPTIYCTARTTSCGSVPSVGGPAGALSLTGGTGSFNVTNGPCPDVAAGGGPGILIHTAAGPDPTPNPLAFGFLCINTPFFRGPVAVPVDGGPTNCDSNYTWNFGLYASNNAGLFNLVAGNTLDLQPWSRDPNNAVNPPGGTANFSNAMGTTIVP